MGMATSAQQERPAAAAAAHRADLLKLGANIATRETAVSIVEDCEHRTPQSGYNTTRNTLPGISSEAYNSQMFPKAASVLEPRPLRDRPPDDDGLMPNLIVSPNNPRDVT